MTRLLILLALALPAQAQAPGPHFVIECGALSGNGKVAFVVEGHAFVTTVSCGKTV